MSYIFILIIFLVAGVSLECVFRPHLFDTVKERVIWTLIILAIGITWDTYAVTHHHWLFPGNDLLGIYVGVLPIEEYFFFIIPPYFAITLAVIIRERMR